MLDVLKCLVSIYGNASVGLNIFLTIFLLFEIDSWLSKFRKRDLDISNQIYISSKKS